ncbi:hypothetical protein [Actinoplanes sp. NPDC048796]|uniref:hypothetical protein n=1 Tax=unclassified Actinoplanes TaxID=2626549 RepID=UPI0033F62582
MPHKGEVAADSIADPAERTQTLTAFLRNAVSRGDQRHAATLIDAIEAHARSLLSADERLPALTELVGATASAGQLRRAEVLTDLIDSPAYQGTALIEIVKVAAAAGDLRRAERLSERIHQIASVTSSPTYRAQMLVALAEVTGLTNTRRLLAETLALGHWNYAVDALADQEPGAVSALIDEYLTSHMRGPDPH